MIKFNNYLIEKISKKDASGIYNLMTENAERFKRFFPITLEQNQSLELAKEFSLRKSKEFNTRQEFLFILKDTLLNKIIGLIYIKELDWNKKQGEFAYCIDKNYEGKGLISISVKKLSVYANQNLGLNIFTIVVHKTNIGSVKVAEKCNFKWQETLPKAHTPPDEPPLDMELYVLKNER